MLPTRDSGGRKDDKVLLGHDGRTRGKDGNIYLTVHCPGYEISYGRTAHSTQGDTFRPPSLVLADLNYNPNGSSSITMAHVVVVISRVPFSWQLRLAPWCTSRGKDHLYDLMHKPAYVRLMQSYDTAGLFCGKLTG